MVLDTKISEICHNALISKIEFIGDHLDHFYCPVMDRREVRNLRCSNLGDRIEGLKFDAYRCLAETSEPKLISYKVEFFELRYKGMFKELK